MIVVNCSTWNMQWRDVPRGTFTAMNEIPSGSGHDWKRTDLGMTPKSLDPTSDAGDQDFGRRPSFKAGWWLERSLMLG
jgi:hypothetical protein